MKKISVMIVILFTTLIGKSQVEDYLSGYKASGIFDTVKAIILIDNKVQKSIQRIEGFAVREWHTWSGGCDPYMNPSYQPEADRWFETGIFLYRNKREIKEKIWQSELLAYIYKPIPKQTTAAISYLNENNVLAKPDTLRTLLTYFDTTHLVTSGTIRTTIDSTTSGTFLTSQGRWSSYTQSHADTTKVILYVDISKTSEKLKLKKIKGYEIIKTFLTKGPEYSYTDEKMKKLDYHLKVIKAIQDPEVIGIY